MASRKWVCRDPARRAEFLALVRERQGSAVTYLAETMSVSRSVIRSLIHTFEGEGKVVSELDPEARRCSRSPPPRVVWLKARRAPRIGKPRIPRGAGFGSGARPVLDWPYAPTGTPPALAGNIQLLAVSGRRA